MMKRVLITGGTSGIGLATAHRLAESHSAIVINGRNGERGAQARAAILERKPDANVRFIAADVSTQDGVASLLAAAMDSFGAPIDVLVNSAGGEFVPTLFHENTPAIVDNVIQHWLIPTIYCCLLALPDLADGAAIVNVASDAGKVPPPPRRVRDRRRHGRHLDVLAYAGDESQTPQDPGQRRYTLACSGNADA